MLAARAARRALREPLAYKARAAAARAMPMPAPTRAAMALPVRNGIQRTVLGPAAALVVDQAALAPELPAATAGSMAAVAARAAAVPLERRALAAMVCRAS